MMITTRSTNAQRLELTSNQMISADVSTKSLKSERSWMSKFTENNLLKVQELQLRQEEFLMKYSQVQ